MKKFLLAALLLAVALGCQNKSADVPVTQGGGQAAPAMGDADNDIKAYREILRKDPRNAGALIKLGNLYMDSNRFAEAVDSYQQALAIDPKDLDVRVDMGTCYRRLGRPLDAIKEYRKAIEIDPRHLNAHLNMGVVMEYDLKDNKGALAEFSKYLEISPDAPNAAAVKEEIEKLKGSPAK